jgi:hypothetical protein
MNALAQLDNAYRAAEDEPMETANRNHKPYWRARVQFRCLVGLMAELAGHSRLVLQSLRALKLGNVVPVYFPTAGAGSSRLEGG